MARAISVDEIDLRAILAANDLTLEPSEREDERTNRLAAEKRAKLLGDIKEMVVFVVVLIVVVVIAGLCAYMIFFDKAATPDAQKWAQTALTALLSGGVSFLFGRALAAK